MYENEKEIPIGTSVKIIDKLEQREHNFGIADEMIKCEGRIGKIVDAKYFEAHRAYGYYLDIDDRKYVWASTTFTVLPKSNIRKRKFQNNFLSILKGGDNYA